MTSVGKDVEKNEPNTMLVGMQIGSNTIEKSIIEICTLVFISTLFSIVKEPKFSNIYETFSNYIYELLPLVSWIGLR